MTRPPDGLVARQLKALIVRQRELAAVCGTNLLPRAAGEALAIADEMQRLHDQLTASAIEPDEALERVRSAFASARRLSLDHVLVKVDELLPALQAVDRARARQSDGE